MCVCSLVILENALFRFLLNPLPVRMWVLLINNCGEFWKTSSLQRNYSVKPYRLVTILKFIRFCWCQWKTLFCLWSFVSWALSIVITSVSSAICEVLSIEIHQFWRDVNLSLWGKNTHVLFHCWWDAWIHSDVFL